jgi:pyruvate, water dikinase
MKAPSSMVSTEPIHWLGHPLCHESAAVGPKAANLSRLAAFHRIPPGFAITAEAATSGCDDIRGGGSLAGLIEAAYHELASRCGREDVPVAVRSSAVDEDGGGTSFAGQHDTYLNIRGVGAVLDAVVRCVRSASTPEVLVYRQRHGLSAIDTQVAVLIQALVASDVSAVVFSANPVTGNRDEIMINASWGLGESVVGGTVTPDTFIVRKSVMRVSSRIIARKERMTILEADGTREVEVPRFLREAPSLTEVQAIEMARLALGLEAHFGWPADIECAIAGGDLNLLQCRPITTLR